MKTDCQIHCDLDIQYNMIYLDPRYTQIIIYIYVQCVRIRLYIIYNIYICKKLSANSMRFKNNSTRVVSQVYGSQQAHDKGHAGGVSLHVVCDNVVCVFFFNKEVFWRS